MKSMKWKRNNFTDSILRKVERNLGKIISAYTLLIVASTYNFTKVQVESAEAINKVNVEKLNFQSSQIELLKAENEQYKNWLLENEKANPVMYNKFKDMQKQISLLQEQLKANHSLTSKLKW